MIIMELDVSHMVHAGQQNVFSYMQDPPVT